MARRSDRVESIDVPAPDGVDTASLIDLIRALGQVSEMQRHALILRYYMGYSNVEIARILGSTPSSIGVQLFRSARRLRGLLSEEMESR
jgi:RNA polymerase sigma factor (sigma-70 family)